MTNEQLEKARDLQHEIGRLQDAVSRWTPTSPTNAGDYAGESFDQLQRSLASSVGKAWAPTLTPCLETMRRSLVDKISARIQALEAEFAAL